MSSPLTFTNHSDTEEHNPAIARTPLMHTLDSERSTRVFGHSGKHCMSWCEESWELTLAARLKSALPLFCCTMLRFTQYACEHTQPASCHFHSSIPDAEDNRRLEEGGGGYPQQVSGLVRVLHCHRAVASL